MLLKKKKTNFLPIGVVLLLFSFILQSSTGIGFIIINFTSGLLMGLSIPMMSAGLYFTGKLNRESAVRGE